MIAAAFLAAFYAWIHWALYRDWGEASGFVLVLIFDVTLIGGGLYELGRAWG